MTIILKWGDVTVPYVAQWSSEEAARVGFDQHAGGEPSVFCGGKRGDGRPVFGKMDFARQRECVWRRRCQVCRDPLDRRFVMGLIPQWIKAGWMAYPLLSEPCVCASCARYALDNCPGLRRQFANPKFFAAEVFEYDRVACFLQPMEQSDFPQLDRVLKEFGKPAVGYMKLQLKKYKTFSLADFRKVLEACA